MHCRETKNVNTTIIRIKKTIKLSIYYIIFNFTRNWNSINLLPFIFLLYVFSVFYIHRKIIRSIDAIKQVISLKILQHRKQTQSFARTALPIVTHMNDFHYSTRIKSCLRIALFPSAFYIYRNGHCGVKCT